MAVEILRRRFSLDEYHRMGEAGILREDDRVELIQGEVVQMTPIGSRHAACVARLNHLLLKAARDRAVVWVQSPIGVPPHSEPQQDLALLRPRDDFYAAGHPEPRDVLLAIEVADTSLDFDRSVKLPLYAEAGIHEVWLVDLPGEAVEVHRVPEGRRYRQVQRMRRDQHVDSQVFPDLRVTVEQVLG